MDVHTHNSVVPRQDTWPASGHSSADMDSSKYQWRPQKQWSWFRCLIPVPSPCSWSRGSCYTVTYFCLHSGGIVMTFLVQQQMNNAPSRFFTTPGNAPGSSQLTLLQDKCATGFLLHEKGLRMEKINVSHSSRFVPEGHRCACILFYISAYRAILCNIVITFYGEQNENSDQNLWPRSRYAMG